MGQGVKSAKINGWVLKVCCPITFLFRLHFSAICLWSNHRYQPSKWKAFTSIPSTNSTLLLPRPIHSLLQCNVFVNKNPNNHIVKAKACKLDTKQLLIRVALCLWAVNADFCDIKMHNKSGYAYVGYNFTWSILWGTVTVANKMLYSSMYNACVRET